MAQYYNSLWWDGAEDEEKTGPPRLGSIGSKALFYWTSASLSKLPDYVHVIFLSAQATDKDMSTHLVFKPLVDYKINQPFD